MKSFVLYGITTAVLKLSTPEIQMIKHIKLPSNEPKIEIVSGKNGKAYNNIILFENNAFPPYDIYLTIYKHGWLPDSRKSRAFLLSYRIFI